MSRPPDDQPPAALRRSTRDLLRSFEGIDQAGLMRRPDPEEWSAWDIAYHIAQIEVWYIAKLCEASSPSPLAALERFLEVWSEMRGRALSLVEAIPAERLDVAGPLSGVPDWTPRHLIERMTAHDAEHAAQVRAARADGTEGR